MQLLLSNIRQLVTVRSGGKPTRTGCDMRELAILENASVLIENGIITWIGNASDFKNTLLPDADTLDASSSVALPGFVDAHTHAIFAEHRVDEYEQRCLGMSYEEIAAAGGGIRASVRSLRQASLSELVTRTERRFRHFLEHGTTTIEAKSGYGLDTDEELKMLRAIAALRDSSSLEVVPTFLGAHAIPDERLESRRDYIDEVIREMIPRVAQEGLASFCDVFCDAGYFDVDEAREILLAARSAGLGLRIHADELGHTGGTRLAAELGVSSADHLEWADEEDIARLRAAGTVATLLPGTAFNLGLSRYPPARKLIEAGVPVALATDFNPGSCFTPNMQLILSIACTQLKMTPAEAVTAATLNGAASLGLSGRLGSIEEGKQADIALMDAVDYREIPYFFGVNHCVAVIKKGRIVVDRMEKP